MRNSSKMTLIEGKPYDDIKVATFGHQKNLQTRRQSCRTKCAEILKKKKKMLLLVLFSLQSYSEPFFSFIFTRRVFTNLSLSSSKELPPACTSARCSIFRCRWKTGEWVACFSLAYTSERKNFLFQLSLRVSNCACAEPKILVLDWRMATVRMCNTRL